MDLLSPIVVLHLGFTFDHPCSRVLSPHSWCCTSFALFSGTFAAHQLSPCSFALLVVLGAMPCFQGVPFRLARAACGLVVSSTTPLLPSACCASEESSPELGCSDRRLAERLHISLLLKAAFLSGLQRSSTPLCDTLSRRGGRDRTSSTTVRYLSFHVSLCSMCYASHIDSVFLCATAPRSVAHASEFCEYSSSSEGTCERLTCGSVFL